MGTRLELIPVGEWNIFPEGKAPMLIAGPCSAESESQVMQTAEGLWALGVNVFRAGVWKPRTHPNTFEGVGAPALQWLGRVQKELGMKVVTEVAGEKHVSDCIKSGVDMVWIGARTTANPFLVQEIADALKGTDIPVLVKNPVSPDIDLWIGALERLNQAGVKKLGVVHRGFSTGEKSRYRNEPLWQIAVELRTRYPELPFFADPSHIGGSREYLHELSQRALDLGLDGLMIESHCDPASAKSDAGQQVTPEDFGKLISGLVVRKADSDSPEYKENIDQLREQIDVIDENLLSLLASRMNLSRSIGKYKKEHNMTILQTGRYNEILDKRGAQGSLCGMDPEFVKEIFEHIHEESVRQQMEIINQK